MNKEVFYYLCNFLNIMVSGDPVIKKVLPVCVASEKALTRKFSAICKCSDIFPNIMINRDLVVKEALTSGVPREQAWTRKYSTICVMSSTICD